MLAKVITGHGCISVTAYKLSLVAFLELTFWNSFVVVHVDHILITFDRCTFDHILITDAVWNSLTPDLLRAALCFLLILEVSECCPLPMLGQCAF